MRWTDHLVLTDTDFDRFERNGPFVNTEKVSDQKLKGCLFVHYVYIFTHRTRSLNFNLKDVTRLKCRSSCRVVMVTDR